MNDPSATIIVPAHDEGAVIDRCLGRLLADAAPGEFDVVVVCNGCTDDTAYRARSHPGVRVEEIATPSKIAALQHGDEVAVTHPRIYLDADVQMSTGTARNLAATLQQPGVLAAAPAPRFDATNASWPVRAYFDLLGRHPVFGPGYVGSGVVGLSQAGRAAFSQWPAGMPDDAFVQRLFPASSKARAAGEFVVTTPRSLGGQLRRSVRVRRLNRRLERDPRLPTSGATTASTRAFLLRHLRRPRSWPGVALFVVVAGASRARAWLADRRDDPDIWLRDESSRGA